MFIYDETLIIIHIFLWVMLTSVRKLVKNSKSEIIVKFYVEKFVF